MNQDIASLLNLEQQLREATDLAQLFHTIVNQTHTCLPYTQAVLLLGGRLHEYQPVAASDIPTIDFTSPFFTWIERLARHLADQKNSSQLHPVDIADVPESLRIEWQEIAAPGHMLWMPLQAQAQEGEQQGILLLLHSQPWQSREQELASHLCGSIGHALFALRRCRWLNNAWKSVRKRRLMAALLLLVVGVMFLPVRLNTLAPVEVVARDPLVISAPINGAVREVMVTPNQQVAKEDLLVQLEDTELASNLEVAEHALLVARAELKTMQQGGFVDRSQKAHLAELEAAVRLRQAEVDQARLRLGKTQLRAPDKGITVLSDPNEWKGRSVQIGERIMLLADASSVELQIMLPVKDSITLQENAEVVVFFDSDPLNAWQARIRHAAYKPQRTPDDQFAYRLIAELDEQGVEQLPRIGMRGTAKVYGGEVNLFFYLFRRPITSMRQWLGW